MRKYTSKHLKTEMCSWMQTQKNPDPDQITRQPIHTYTQPLILLFWPHVCRICESHRDDISTRATQVGDVNFETGDGDGRENPVGTVVVKGEHSVGGHSSRGFATFQSIITDWNWLFLNAQEWHLNHQPSVATFLQSDRPFF